MLEISQIKLPCGSDPAQLEKNIRRILRISSDEKFTWKITRHSVDARKKPELYDVYSVHVELADAGMEERIAGKKRTGSRVQNVRQTIEVPYIFPKAPAQAPLMEGRPVVIGFGPAGIFSSLMLARAGFRPIVLERGQQMEERLTSVDRFWKEGRLNPESNIQFGEGGAGTFSDGKLNSNVKDKSGRIGEVIRTFLAAGAPEDIAYEQIPHIGTDRLRDVIRRIREEIISLGGEIRFNVRADRLILKDGKVCGVSVSEHTGNPAPGQHYNSVDATKLSRPLDGIKTLENADTWRTYRIDTPCVILAPGHSARDTIRALLGEGVPMESKPFAVGFRVSHPQALINHSQYGISDPEEMKRLRLTPANYKLTARASDGRGVYSFCMCPGGYVVNASSEPGRLAVNGMSNYKRDAARANSAIVITVGPEDFADQEKDDRYRNDVLSGCRFQEKLEEKAYHLCEGKVPVQRFSSFESGKEDTDIPSSEDLCIMGASGSARLDTLLPRNLTKDFVEGMHDFGHRMEGFDGPEAYVIGLESRTSSPVRILRDENGESAVRGLYPCGEGAGFAGGITSAAVDGIRTAENIARRFRPPKQ